MNSSKINKLILIIAPLIAICLFLFISYEKPLYFSGDKSQQDIYVHPYSDKNTGGDTEITNTSEGDNLSYSYTEGKIKEYPYAGIMVYNEDSSFFDISQYTHVSFDIHASKGESIPFYITCNIPNYSNWDTLESFFCLQNTLLVSNEWEKLELAFNDFVTPGWWYTNINKTESEIGSADLSQTNVINFANCMMLDKGESDTISIKNIVFYKNLNPYFIYSSAFLFIYYILFIFIIRRRKNALQNRPLFNYTQTKTTSIKNKELEKIFEYINANYQNSKLTIINVQNETGISERKISNLIKSEAQLNFKQFLNNLRIEEAKRLIKETDLHISEVAFKTGYGNVSHFNRVFKSILNISPSEYRKSK